MDDGTDGNIQSSTDATAGHDVFCEDSGSVERLEQGHFRLFCAQGRRGNEQIVG